VFFSLVRRWSNGYTLGSEIHWTLALRAIDDCGLPMVLNQTRAAYVGSTPARRIFSVSIR